MRRWFRSAVAPGHTPATHTSMRWLFDGIDADGDGLVSDDDWLAVFDGSRRTAAELFGAYVGEGHAARDTAQLAVTLFDKLERNDAGLLTFDCFAQFVDPYMVTPGEARP